MQECVFKSKTFEIIEKNGFMTFPVIGKPVNNMIFDDKW